MKFVAIISSHNGNRTHIRSIESEVVPTHAEVRAKLAADPELPETFEIKRIEDSREGDPEE